MTACWRSYQDSLRSDSMNRLVPWCRADGSYSPVQCYSSYCYCVNDNGQEISNTRTYIETGKPKCTHTSKLIVALLLTRQRFEVLTFFSRYFFFLPLPWRLRSPCVLLLRLSPQLFADVMVKSSGYCGEVNIYYSSLTLR